MFYIIAIIAGMFIGWLTNVLAIEMMFRPKKPVLFFGKRLPFTPGLIPLHKTKMLKTATKKITKLVLDSFVQKQIDETSPQYQLFNKALDSYWASYVFLPPVKRKRIYSQLITKIQKESQIEKAIEQILQKQIATYNVTDLELTVKDLASTSLNGIKLIGAFAGALVGLLTVLLGGI